jgi:hypothetical protein
MFNIDTGKDIFVVRTPLKNGLATANAFLASPAGRALLGGVAKYAARRPGSPVIQVVDLNQVGGHVTTTASAASRLLQGTGSGGGPTALGLGMMIPGSAPPTAPQPPPAGGGCHVPCGQGDCADKPGTIQPRYVRVATVENQCGAIINVNFPAVFLQPEDEFLGTIEDVESASQGDRVMGTGVASGGTVSAGFVITALAALGAEIRVSLPDDGSHGTFMLTVRATCYKTEKPFAETYALQSTARVSSFTLPLWEIVRRTQMKYRGIKGGEGNPFQATLDGVPDGTTLTALSVQTEEREQAARFLLGRQATGGAS